MLNIRPREYASGYGVNIKLIICYPCVVCTETKRANIGSTLSVCTLYLVQVTCYQLILLFLESKLWISSSSRASIIHRPSMQDEKSNLKVGASDPNRVMMTQKPTRFNDATRSLSRSAMVIINVAWIVMLSS